MLIKKASDLALTAVRSRFQGTSARRTINFCTASVFAASLLGLLIDGKAAWASFIALDDPTFGANALVLDTSTGLEWLNAKFSDGLSVGEVEADLLPGGKFAGYRYASRAEFENLSFEFFGGDPIHISPLIPYATIAQFISLFGPTFSVIGLPALDGFYEPQPFPPGGPSAFIASFQPTTETGPLTGFADRQCCFGSDFDAGSFLIASRRAVPEPASLSVFGAGLLIIAVLIMRRRRDDRFKSINRNNSSPRIPDPQTAS